MKQMTATTKRILYLVALYCLFDVLFKLTLYFQPWVAVTLPPVAYLFVSQAVRLYRDRKALRKATAGADGTTPTAR